MTWLSQLNCTLATAGRALFVAVPLLAGCTYQNVGDVRALDTTGGGFADLLSTEYRQLALYEADDMADWIDADHFAGKALDAAQGAVRAPEPVEDWDIDDDRLSEFRAARDRLMIFLNAGGGALAPQHSATAQARFDCWLEQQEEGWQFDHIALCRDGFYAAMDQVEAAVRPKTTLLFEFDSDVMTEEHRAGLRFFVRDLEKFHTGAVLINGHADRAGTSPYNHRLSRARSIAVWRELVEAGVSPDRIAISAYGETRPVVDTPDGLREPLNRRAEIELRLPPLYASITPSVDLARATE